MLLFAQMTKRKAQSPGEAIQAYIEKYGISQQDFADRLEVSQGLVSQWIQGKVRVTPERGADIIRETEGEVSREILFPELFEDRAA